MHRDNCNHVTTSPRQSPVDPLIRCDAVTPTLPLGPATYAAQRTVGDEAKIISVPATPCACSNEPVPKTDQGNQAERHISRRKYRASVPPGSGLLGVGESVLHQRQQPTRTSATTTDQTLGRMYGLTL